MLKTVTQLCQKQNIRYLLNEPMRHHTSFKVGGCADILLYPKTNDDLKVLVKALKNDNIPYMILGFGSNLLVSDSGIEGAVICLSENKSISLNDNEITASAGLSVTALCNFAAENLLSGLEFAFGIPGSVGGAVYMNAGAYGGEVCDVIKSVTCLNTDGKVVKLNKDELNLSYRNSRFKTSGEIILDATFALKQDSKTEIKARMDDFFSRRKEKQPLEYPSAGSTFKRPEGYFAGTLIEQSGLKGVGVGDAFVSEKHAGFIVNKGNATCNDIKELIGKVQLIVKEKHGVDLETEVIFIGRK